MNVRHTKLRIDTIKQRTDSTVLPAIDAVYKKHGTVDLELTRKFVDQVTFSDYEGIHQDGPVILDTFLMNKRNINQFKSSGSLGAIIEGFRRVDISKEFNSEVLTHLISALNVITNDDSACQARLLSNPHTLPLLKELCLHCIGENQLICFQILDRLSRISTNNVSVGMAALMESNIFDVLFTPETWYRPSTLVSVRQMCCQMINRLTHFSPYSFPVPKMMELILDKYGVRRVDGYMEVHLLNALLCHLNRLSGLDSHGHPLTRDTSRFVESNKFPDKLPFVLTTARHLINEVLCESFENLEHLQLIIKVIILLSKCPMQASFLVENSLGMALQFLVKTDFSLYRKSSKNANSGKGSNGKGGGNKLKEKMDAIQHSYKRRSIQDCGDRDKGSLMALALITPDGKANRNEDANFFATKSVISIYENVMQGRIETINEVVASGLISSLLYRVGKGNERDMRFNKLVVDFLYEIMFKVCSSQCDAQNHLSFVDLNGPRFKQYKRFNFNSFADYPFADETHNPAEVAKKDITVINPRGIANTLHAQGVTSMLYANVAPGSEDLVVMTKALFTISYLSFSVIAPEAYVQENIVRVFTCSSRNDATYPSLQIICEMILYPEVTNDILTHMLKVLKVVKPLMAALAINGWKFHMKSTLFICLGKLAHLADFRDSVAESGGMGLLSFEVLNRKLTYRTYDFGYRYYKNTIEDECCDRIYMAIRRDMMVIKIQALVRRKLGWVKFKKKKRTALK